MASVGNSNPWAPYESYKDCSLGICSQYCPQWCYINFPPPPADDDDDSGTPFSPLIIAIIGVLASAFLLVSYYTIVTRYCKRRNGQNRNLELGENRDEMGHDQWQVVGNGLDEALIKTITVCKYVKGDGLIEGTDCAVCLSEFQENESLRLLPKCSHAFHLPCIDTWLKSHSNCPLCRANVCVANPLPPPVLASQNSSTLNVASLETQRQSDLILVVEDEENREQVVVNLAGDDLPPKSPVLTNGCAEDPELRNEDDVEQFRRSISLGAFPSQRQVLIADILREAEDELQAENYQSRKGIGSSNNGKDLELLRSPVAMKRSISASRFMCTFHDKGGKDG